MWFRKNQSGVEQNDGVGGADKRPRRERGWGPFSGGQLTIIIVTFAVLLLFPIGAWAVTGSNVFVTDSTSGAHAKVDAKQNVNTAIHDPVSGQGASVTLGSGSLGYLHTTAHIADGITNTFAKVDAKNNLNTAIHDSGTGTAAKVNGSGQLSVAATGSVTATPAAPSAMFTAYMTIGNGTLCGGFTSPAGSAAVITSIDLGPRGTTGVEMNITIYGDNAVGCGGTQTIIAADSFNTDTPYSPSVGSGIGLAAGHVLDVQNSGTGPGQLDVTVHGYYVPAAQCSTGCL